MSHAGTLKTQHWESHVKLYRYNIELKLNANKTKTFEPFLGLRALVSLYWYRSVITQTQSHTSSVPVDYTQETSRQDGIGNGSKNPSEILNFLCKPNKP